MTLTHLDLTTLYDTPEWQRETIVPKSTRPDTPVLSQPYYHTLGEKKRELQNCQQRDVTFQKPSVTIFQHYKCCVRKSESTSTFTSTFLNPTRYWFSTSGTCTHTTSINIQETGNGWDRNVWITSTGTSLLNLTSAVNQHKKNGHRCMSLCTLPQYPREEGFDCSIAHTLRQSWSHRHSCSSVYKSWPVALRI